ncbi:MAG: HAD family hydrolase [Chloroflexi bacterium]|nr:HAD family hydrolase [Chloroflexota bacterium]
MIQAVTFDFWDTLVADDSDEPRRKALGLPTKAQARLQLLVDEITNYHSQITPEQISAAFAHANDRFRHFWKNEHHTPSVAARLQVVYDFLKIPLTPRFSEIVRQVEDMEVMIPPTFVPGARDVLAELSQHYALGIVSDTIHTSGRGIRTLLESQGVLEYFRAFIFSDEAGASKPKPIVFERAAAELGVPLAQIVHVGDRESNDVDGPFAVGMKAILFTGVVDRGSANTRANAICREFVKLPDVIQQLD